MRNLQRRSQCKRRCSSVQIISHEQAAIDLATGEFLIGVQGRAGAYVDEIEFVMNKRVRPIPLKKRGILSRFCFLGIALSTIR